MNIKVRFIGPTKIATGTSEAAVEISGNTFGDVIDNLVARYGDRFRQEIFQPDGSINKGIKFYINGSIVAYDMLLEDAIVSEGDTLDIFPPFYGG